MIRFLIRRIFFLIFTLLFVSMAIFAISEIAPGNIAINSLGNTITPQQEASFQRPERAGPTVHHPLYPLAGWQRVAGGTDDRHAGHAHLRSKRTIVRLVGRIAQRHAVSKLHRRRQHHDAHRAPGRWHDARK